MKIRDRFVRGQGDGGHLLRPGHQECPESLATVTEHIQVKLDSMNATLSLQDLRVPPSNGLEKLRGDVNGS
jgi:plasmid maintenance system killer protein